VDAAAEPAIALHEYEIPGPKMNRAFTLVEMLIVVAILGILAALVLPRFRGHILEARESAARDNLRILRQQIEMYAARHVGVPPGYPNDDTAQSPAFIFFYWQLVKMEHYLSDLPENPVNYLKTIKILADTEDFPAGAAGSNGWIYKPAIKAVRLDWPGTDKKGIRYYDY